MNTIQQAEALQVRCTGILADAGLDDVAVILDPLEIPAALGSGQTVIAIQPPELAFTTWAATDSTWELWIIAGPPDDRMEAWRNLQPVMDALIDPLAITTARPATWDHPGMPDMAAYVLSFTETN